MREGRLWLGLVTVVLVSGVALVGAESPPAFEHPAVQEVLTMVKAELSERVVLERVNNIGAFPDLDGETLAALSELGVPEQVLVRMIQLEKETAPEAPRPQAVQQVPSPAVEPRDADLPTAAPLAPGQAGLRVVVERSFKITFLEVMVDGGEAVTKGKLWEGEGMTGERIERPRWVKTETPLVAFEGPVAAGQHKVGVGFAITQVEMDDPNDEWGEYSQERYVSRGVRASGEPIGEGKEETMTPVSCEVLAGEICEVKAVLEQKRTGKFGGIPTLAVRYEVGVIPAIPATSPGPK